MAAYVHCTSLLYPADAGRCFDSASGKRANGRCRAGKKGRDFLEKQKYQTLYLLHGFTGDHLSYLRTSKIERYADEHQIMVVMPSVYNSAYTDMKYGLIIFLI